jgi:hypothetical protein
MATNFPGSLDTSTQQPSPSSSTEMDDSGYEHDVVHTNHSGAIIALETKFGTGASNAASASDGHVLTADGSGGSAWEAAAGGASISISDTAPGSPSAGDLWYESDTGKTFVYYADGSSNQWVEIGASSAAAAGATGQVQYASSGAFASSANFTYDGSDAVLKSTLTVGVDDTGHDVKFFGAAAGSHLLWDESENRLDVVASSGAAYIRSLNGTATTYIGSDSSNTALFGTSTAHDTRFISNNTERMRIASDGELSVKVNGTNECMKVSLGSDLHDSTGDSDTEYGAVGFAAAGVFLDRNWMGQPGITVLNSNAAGSSEASQSTFRIHGSNQSWASYPSSSGSDFAVDLTIDGSNYNTSDERRKTNIEDITGALAMVNNMRGRTFNTVNSSLEVEDSKTLGGKKYGFVAQEVMDIVPNAVMKDDAAAPLENGWCRAYLLDYSSLTAVLVEAIKEITTRLETLEAV